MIEFECPLCGNILRASNRETLSLTLLEHILREVGVMRAQFSRLEREIFAVRARLAQYEQ